MAQESLLPSFTMDGIKGEAQDMSIEEIDELANFLFDSEMPDAHSLRTGTGELSPSLQPGTTAIGCVTAILNLWQARRQVCSRDAES